MKAVVFGGSGFLGSHVADTLTGKGYNVIVFDKVKSSYLQSNQKMVIGDILDQNKVQNTIKGADCVYDFAGIADIDEAKHKPIETVKYNVLATMYMLEACRKYKVERFLYASSVYVYSELGSFYRSSKQSSELFIENYQKMYGLNFTILRYGSLYGRRANQFNFINKIIKQALLDGKIQREGDGEEIRDYINVLDAAKSSVEVLEKKEFVNSYVMVTGMQTIKVKEMLKMIREMLNNKIVIEYLKKTNEEHYEITPYTFRPRVAQKYVLQSYHDLGQGILDCIYEVYKQLDNNKTKLHVAPKSIKY